VWRQRELEGPKLEAAWAALAADAAKAWLAIWELAASPEATVRFLKERLRPEAPVPADKLSRLIADLDSDQFSTRQRATEEMEQIGEQAVPALRRAIAGTPSLELRRRVEALLQKAEIGPPFPEQLRTLRAIAALEQIGSAEAQEVLKEFAKGAPEASASHDAKAALERLSRATPGR
jgi:hypothetical protein